MVRFSTLHQRVQIEHGKLVFLAMVLPLDLRNGRVDFGSVELDANFSVSFWMRPDSVDSNKTLILSKEGISGMNVLRIEKGEGNSSIQVYLSLDGINESL